MKRIIVQTKDGSPTLFVPELDEHYHSVHGALSESEHVFIRQGLEYLASRQTDPIRILELGFGTGLNAILSWEYADSHQHKVEYIGYELYPIDKDIAGNVGNFLGQERASRLARMHDLYWDEQHNLSDFFKFRKKEKDIKKSGEANIDLVYFDAFAPSVQPELWKKSIFETIGRCMHPGSVLVTYCAKGQVKRDLNVCGFDVETLPGPPGKREMTRAKKI